MGSQRARIARDAAEKARDQERRDILARHCRLSAAGTPLSCAPTKKEKENPESHWRGQGDDDKVILLNEKHAEECARELAVLYGKPMRAYECPRSKRGHFHVTSQAGRRGR